MEEQKMSQRRTRAQLGLRGEDGSSASRSDALFPKIRHKDVLKVPIIVSLLLGGFLPKLQLQMGSLGSKCPSVLTQPLHADHDRQSQE